MELTPSRLKSVRAPRAATAALCEGRGGRERSELGGPWN